MSMRSMFLNSEQFLSFSLNCLSITVLSTSDEIIQVTALLVMWEYELPNYNPPPKNPKTNPPTLEVKYFTRNSRKPLIQLPLLVNHFKEQTVSRKYKNIQEVCLFQMAPVIAVVSVCYDLLFNHLGLAASGR